MIERDQASPTPNTEVHDHENEHSVADNGGQEEYFEGDRLFRNERIDVGVDVHKRTYSVTSWSERRQSVVTRWTQPADPKALIRGLTPYKRRIDRVVYEAGPTGCTLARALREAGFRAAASSN